MHATADEGSGSECLIRRATPRRPRRSPRRCGTLRVEDVLVQTLVTVSTIGYRSLGVTEETNEARDLEQTRLAIETMRALTPVLAQVVPPELTRDFEASVASLQLAYAKAASDAGAR